MYSSINKHFIFKQSSGKVWNFYFDEKLGICQSTLNKSNAWSESVSLQKNAHQPFFADIDYADQIYILFQDRQGSIFCSLINNESAKTMPILNSKVPTVYDKHLSLIPVKGSCHIFYVIQHENSWVLAHQILADGITGNPKVIDYVAKNDCPYSVVQDKSGNINVFYQAFDDKYYQLGYKKYIPSQKFWGEFTPVTRYKGDSEYPRTIVDSKNIIHICYQRRSDKQYELVYQQKIQDKNIWTNENVLHSSIYPFFDSSIACINDNLIVYWVRDNIIYYCSSPDEGNTWSKPAKYNFSGSKQLMCFRYKSNNPYQSEKIIAESIPGSYMNGFKLAFYQEARTDSSNFTADEMKRMIVDGLNLLKNSVDELKESNSKTMSDISSLRAAQQNFEKELVKYSIRLGLLENDINQVRFANEQIEVLKNALEEHESKLVSIPPDFDGLKSELLSDIISSNILQKNNQDIDLLQTDVAFLKSNLNKKKPKVVADKDKKP